MTRLLAIAGLLIGLTAPMPAFADRCPKEAYFVDRSLAKFRLDDDLAAKVKSLRNEGLEMHKSGQHRRSLAILSDATNLILSSIDVCFFPDSCIMEQCGYHHHCPTN